MLLFRWVVLMSTIISTQFSEESNLPELTSHRLDVVKDGQNRILAIKIIINEFSQVRENTFEKLISFNCNLRPSTPKTFKKYALVLKNASISIDP